MRSTCLSCLETKGDKCHYAVRCIYTSKTIFELIKYVLMWEIPRWTISRSQKILVYIIKPFRLDHTCTLSQGLFYFFFLLSVQRDFKKNLWNLLHSIFIENNSSLKSCRKFGYRETVWVFESLRSSSELYLSCTWMCYSTPKNKMKSDQYK